MTEIHLLIAGATVGDAITNYAFEIRGILREAGIQSHIYAPYQHTSSKLRKDVLPVADNLATINNKEVTLFYQFSIASVMTQYFMNSPARKVICYQNITPANYLRGLNDQAAKNLYNGRKELEKLVDTPDITLATSRFNACELEELGYNGIHIIPLSLSTDYLKTQPSEKILKAYKDSLTTFLFVGRVSPNKKLEDVLRVFYYYNKTINPSSRLIFVGSYGGMEKYYTYLRSYANAMGLHNVIFTGHVSLKDLLGYYASSTLFLCMSEHEGVCIPLIESMYFGKPVFGLARAAVPETMGDAGIVIHQKDHRAIAELIDIVLNDKNNLKNIIENQNERLKYFQRDILKEKLKSILGF